MYCDCCRMSICELSLKVLLIPSIGKMEELLQSQTVNAGSFLYFVSRQYNASKKNVWLFC